MKKKLISFDDDQAEAIDEFAVKHGHTFTEALRVLVEAALKLNFDETLKDSESAYDKINNIEKQVKKMSWWAADDGSHRLNNLEVELDNIKKQINVLTAASKLFKAHVSDREIHLQD